MSQTQPVVAIVEDDVSIQRALARLLYAAGWQAVTFPSAEAFLQTGMEVLMQGAYGHAQGTAPAGDNDAHSRL